MSKNKTIPKLHVNGRACLTAIVVIDLNAGQTSCSRDFNGWSQRWAE